MKLTKIGLALLVALALSALTASAATALQYKSSSSPVMLLGTQSAEAPLVFKFDNSNVECSGATFEKASLTTPANEITGIDVAFTSCTGFGISVSTNWGTCGFKSGALDANRMANVDIACNSNANVNGNATNNGDIRVYGSIIGNTCEIHIETQNSKSTVTFVNNTPSGGKVRMGLALTGLIAEKTVDNGICQLNGIGVTNNATLNGNIDWSGTGGITWGVE